MYPGGTDIQSEKKTYLGGLGCLGCAILWVVVGLTIGAVCVHYTLNFWVGIDPPLWACAGIGMVTSGVVVPAGVITGVCDLGGLDGPMWPLTDKAKAEKASGRHRILVEDRRTDDHDGGRGRGY